MYTSQELQMLRNADPGAVLPGVDTPTGNLRPVGDLISALSPPQGAPWIYDPIHNRVIVTKAGAVLNGINFGSVTLDIGVNNVTVENCTFSGTTGYYSLVQESGASGATVENCTFTGPKYSSSLAAFVQSTDAITVENNSFVDTANWAVSIRAGVVTGNSFSGGGYRTGAHADAIVVGNTTGPVSVTNNFVDWTPNADAATGTNFAIFLDTIQGPVSDVTVSGNYLLGGTYTVDDASAYTNVSVSDNYIGFSKVAAFYPGAMNGVNGLTQTGNVIFDWTQPIFSTEAWSAYDDPVPTANLVTSTGGNIINSSSLPTTLYSGYNQTHLYAGYYGSTSETNFVGGYGRQYMNCGPGANIVTELAISDSTPNGEGCDCVAGFDPAKDVIDLSNIDADVATAGVQNFSFVGTAAFTGSGGGQVRYQQDPTHNFTDVYVALAGDTSPDMEIQLNGLLNLTAANFALTAAQSSADMAAGASLRVTKIKPAAGSAMEYAYTNVSGRPYSSFEAINCGGYLQADNLNLSMTANELDLQAGSLTITRGSGAESIGVGTSSFSLGEHPNEVVQASNQTGETFKFGANFGSETINGFDPNTDTIQLKTSSFSYLNSGMTQAQDLAAVLAQASGASGTTILDSRGDSLTLAGVGSATIAANPSHFSFV